MDFPDYMQKGLAFIVVKRKSRLSGRGAVTADRVSYPLALAVGGYLGRLAASGSWRSSKGAVQGD